MHKYNQQGCGNYIEFLVQLK